MANVYDELLRLTKPIPILDVLDGKPSSYDIDGEWTPHYQGRPRCDTKGAFGDPEFIAGVKTIAYLAPLLPVGTTRRRALLDLHRKITARLSNPRFLCFGGFDAPRTPPVSEALVVEGTYLYFRPALLRNPSDLDLCEANTRASWPNEPYPWSSTFPVWKVWTSPGFAALIERLETTPVPEGRCEIDPRAAAPELVTSMRELHDLDEDAATLFLQFLTLADCADAVLTEVNDWKPARYKAATAALVEKGLLVERKQPRAQRKCVLPGTWETLKPPNPALETWKLPLYDAQMQGEAAIAPLGRLLPLRPVHRLFKEAFERHAAEAPGAQRRRENAPAAATARDWMSDIAANLDDDDTRMVYADWLSDHGDPRGEFIAIQVQLAALERAGAGSKVAELRVAAANLLTQHRAAWTEAIHPFVKDARFERGFVVGVTARPLTFAKNARVIFDACPLIHELVIDAGPVGPVMTVHWETLGACEDFARITHLDTTSDHYIASRSDLERLLNAPYFPRLRHLRLGYHRTNEGFGLAGTEVLAACEKLSELRFLELPGMQIGIRSLRALLESPQLSKLETLRVPYNNLKDAHAKALVKDLKKGLAPALRTLDFSNVMAASFITQAVDRFARNSVSDETVSDIETILGRRTLSASRTRASSPSAAR